MVQALRELLREINRIGGDDAPLKRALSSFECAYEGAEADDVKHFLSESAIEYEKCDITRTYLILNDEAWKNGTAQIDGFFSLSVKVLCFNDADVDILRSAFNDESRKNRPVYLIGQLARGKYAPKGSGGEYLDMAISYIKRASDLIGGNFIYLDCVPERQEYYERHGFAFLQKKHKRDDLIQMYTLL